MPRDRRSLPWHVLGVAAVPVLFLFAENADEQLTLAPLWPPLAMALGGSIVTLLACAALLRDWRRGGLLASLLLIGFFSFGHAWAQAAGPLDHPAFLLAAYELPLLVGAVLIWRGGGWVGPVSRYLNLAAALMVVFNVWRVADFAIVSRTAAVTTGTIPALTVGQAGRPDIYYLILDRYAGNESLRAYYDYDNTPFLDALADRGFAVAGDSWANYFKTALSLVGSLSLDYLDPAEYNGSGPDSFYPIHSALRGRLAVPAALKQIGYEYVLIRNYWEPTRTNIDADVVPGNTDVSEFQAAVAQTTALVLLAPPAAPDDDPETIAFPELARRTTLFGFNQLEAARDRAGPTFVFAHILVPHPPYVFNADGSMPTDAEARSRSEEQKYVEQLKWTNQRVLEMIDHLLDVPPGEEPIIIVQADEGPWPARFRADQTNFAWLEATPDEVARKFGILNAYHLPGVSGSELNALGFYDRISPVNLFRIVFNAYFGTDLPMLPDVTYLSPDYDHMYDLVEYDRDAAPPQAQP